jgi:S-adenosylmethionine hydrolase
VRAGALTLWRTAPWLAPGVVLAVVDPGVGTSRRAVAVEVATAAGPLQLVGPDNGLLLPAALAAGGALRAVWLSDPAWHLPPPPATGRDAAAPGRGRTFDGRDVFAPAAAHLANGVPLERLGPALDPDDLEGEAVGAAVAAPGGGVSATVLWVDHFGNAQLDLAAGHLPEGAALAVVLPDGRDLPVATAGAFAELPQGRPGLVTDSYGLTALCLDRASAAAAYGLAPGQRVVVRPAGPFP